MANMDKSKTSRANANSQIHKEKDLINNGISLFNLMFYISQKCPIQMFPPLLIGNWNTNLQMDTFPTRTWGSWTFGHSWHFWGLFSETIKMRRCQQISESCFSESLMSTLLWSYSIFSFRYKFPSPPSRGWLGCPAIFACSTLLVGMLCLGTSSQSHGLGKKRKE